MSYNDLSGAEVIAWYEAEDLEALFLGRRIVSAELKREAAWDEQGLGLLTLDDGRVVELIPNEGAVCCNSGIYAVKDLLACDHIITSVRVKKTDLNRPMKQYKGKRGKKAQRTDLEDGYAYELFVFAEDTRLRIATVEGDDGNGCYGTGFSLRVRRA